MALTDAPLLTLGVALERDCSELTRGPEALGMGTALLLFRGSDCVSPETVSPLPRLRFSESAVTFALGKLKLPSVDSLLTPVTGVA